jgi:hypothetical protein
MVSFKRICLLSTAAGGLLASTAMAQGNFYNRDKYEAVLDRAQPEYDPEPIRLGGALVAANASAAAVYNDNIFAAETDEQSDLIARLGLEVDARSNWSRHEIGGSVAAIHREYTDVGDESNTDIRAGLRGRVDVSRQFSVSAGVRVEDRIEPRTAVTNSTRFAEPIDLDRPAANIDAVYANERLQVRAGLGITETDFSDATVRRTGEILDQDYRDNTVTSASARVSYAISPDIAVFGQGRVSEREFDTQQLVGGALRTRDSEGYATEVGVDFELQRLIRGDIAVGYLSEDKKDDFYEDVDGLSVRGELEWFPTRLTTVTLDGVRQVVDMGVSAAPSALETTFGARVDHELRRNIILSANASVGNLDYKDVDREDDIVELGLTGIYKMNKKVHLEAFVRRMDRDTSGNAALGFEVFAANTIGVGFKYHP